MQPATTDRLSSQLFALDSRIRSVALSQNGRMVEVEQSPGRNGSASDHKAGGGADGTGGIRYVAICYGLQYQLLFPYGDGHLAVMVDQATNLTEVADRIASFVEASS